MKGPIKAAFQPKAQPVWPQPSHAVASKLIFDVICIFSALPVFSLKIPYPELIVKAQYGSAALGRLTHCTIGVASPGASSMVRWVYFAAPLSSKDALMVGNSSTLL